MFSPQLILRSGEATTILTLGGKLKGINDLSMSSNAWPTAIATQTTSSSKSKWLSHEMRDEPNKSVLKANSNEIRLTTRDRSITRMTQLHTRQRHPTQYSRQTPKTKGGLVSPHECSELATSQMTLFSWPKGSPQRLA